MISPVASLRFVKKRFRPSEKGFGQQAVNRKPFAQLLYKATMNFLVRLSGLFGVSGLSGLFGWSGVFGLFGWSGVFG
ncbi:MAG: hypothetical protein JRI41_03935 [Deltaproteobacteria bacterium]|nr:hypothetical protein [Deltaproteobacteria bacterium]